MITGAGLASLFVGFGAAALFDRNVASLIRAEGDASDEGKVTAHRWDVEADPDVWPTLEHSFPQELDLLSPEPLAVPVPSLGPSRLPKSTLTAAVTASMRANNTEMPIQSPSVPDKQAPETSDVAAPTTCLPEKLRAVLIDLQSRFENVTIVSTKELHTDNRFLTCRNPILLAEQVVLRTSATDVCAKVAVSSRARP
jgi:hypothetical protein